jgi:hypothetical protein
MLGMSGRYNSHMQNIDRAFRRPRNSSEIADFNPGIRKWRKEHTSGDYVFDLSESDTRFARESTVCSHHHQQPVLNREYAIQSAWPSNNPEIYNGAIRIALTSLC